MAAAQEVTARLSPARESDAPCPDASYLRGNLSNGREIQEQYAIVIPNKIDRVSESFKKTCAAGKPLLVELGIVYSQPEEKMARLSPAKKSDAPCPDASL